MRPRTHHNTRGFTLAEMLISLALMSMLVAAAAVAIYAAEASHAYNTEKNELVSRARGVLDRIATDVRGSSSHTVSGGNTLAVTLPSGLIHTYQYSSAGGGTILYSETDGLTTTSPIVMSGYVQSLSISDTSSSVRLQLALKGTQSQCQVTITATPVKALF
jgi:prepilin-type N-terminal cleavage/methylation domain-containing protein